MLRDTHGGMRCIRHAPTLTLTPTFLLGTLTLTLTLTLHARGWYASRARTRLARVPCAGARGKLPCAALRRLWWCRGRRRLARVSRTYGREAPLLTNRRGGAGAYESARAAADDLDAHHPARAHVEALDGPAEDPRAEVLDDAVPPRYDCAHVDGKVDRLLEPIPLRIEDDLRVRVRVSGQWSGSGLGWVQGHRVVRVRVRRRPSG